MISSASFPSPRHLAMSGDIFSCHTGDGEAVLIVSNGYRPGMLLRTAPHNRNDLAPNVTSGKVETPRYRPSLVRRERPAVWTPLYRGPPADDNLPILVSTLGTLEWGFHQGISALPSTPRSLCWVSWSWEKLNNQLILITNYLEEILLSLQEELQARLTLGSL